MITIDPEFRSLIPPLTKEEYRQLETNILAEGCRDAFVVWPVDQEKGYCKECYKEVSVVRGDGIWECPDCGFGIYPYEEVIVDGHNRHDICTKHGMPFETVEMEFTGRAEVRRWIIANQLGRRNLTPEKFAYMIGKLYEERKQDKDDNLRQGIEVPKPQNDASGNTAEIIGEEYKVGKATIERAANYSKAVDLISKTLGEEAKHKILNRDVDITRRDVLELARLKPTEQKAVFQKLEREDHKTAAQLIVSSNSNEWYTPEKYVEAAREVMDGIDIDPATCEKANATVKAKHIYTADTNGLMHDWPGRVWLNPPYGGLTEEFTTKLLEQYCQGIATEAVFLVNSHATDTKWFQPLWDFTLCFTDHRINFISPNGGGVGSTHGSVFVYLGPKQQAFARVFSQFGAIVRRYSP